MRMASVSLATQVAVCAVLLVVAIVGLVILAETRSAVDAVADRLSEMASREEAALLLTEASDRARVSSGVLAIITAVGFLGLLLGGGWAARHVVRPIRRLNWDTRALVEGHLTRRVPEGEAVEDLAAISAAVNTLADRLQRLEVERQPDALLVRAAVARLFDDAAVAGGVLDSSGRLVAANESLRTFLRDARLKPSALLGRDGDAPPGFEAVDLDDAGIMRGYLAQRRGAQG